jgi:hypothetical protein
LVPAPATATAPGEGERRAQRGYVRQYDLGARVVYEALAAGRLEWVGAADRGAGAFDDVVLGLRNRLPLTRSRPTAIREPFSIRTILLGAEQLWGRMLASRSELGAEHRDASVETIYVCDGYPRTNDPHPQVQGDRGWHDAISACLNRPCRIPGTDSTQ